MAPVAYSQECRSESVCLFGLGPCDHGYDKGGFGFSVGLVIGTEPDGQILLQFVLLASDLGMGLQIIAEEQVFPPKVACLFNHVEVSMRFRRALMEKASLLGARFRLADILAADASERFNAVLSIGKVTNTNHDVDDGLSTEPWNGGASHMFYGHDLVPDGAENHGFLLLIDR